jgi:hypothetical protein
MQIRTLRTIPRVILMLAFFSLSVWLLGKSALPKERTADTVLAIGMLIVQVLIARNRYVSEREAEDRIQERRSPWPQ